MILQNHVGTQLMKNFKELSVIFTRNYFIEFFQEICLLSACTLKVLKVLFFKWENIFPKLLQSLQDTELDFML